MFGIMQEILQSHPFLILFGYHETLNLRVANGTEFHGLNLI